MKDQTVKSKRALTGPGARLIVATVAGGCLAVVLAAPQGYPPTGGPSLRLEPTAAMAVLERDARLAEAAPDDGLTQALYESYLAHGEAEVGEGESEQAFRDRNQQIRTQLAAVRDAHGDEGVQALRAQAVEGLADALAGRDSDEAGRLGAFPRMLERYGVMRDGQRRAPELVLRALFSARWNGIMGLELTDGFEAVEHQAYWGWLALTESEVPPERRRSAIRAFVEYDGLDSLEASAWSAFQSGEYARAAREYQAASELTGNLRLRNHAIASQALIE